MPTIHALFDSYADARRAVNALEAHGIEHDDISVIANKSDEIVEEPDNRIAEGAELGTDIGAIAGGAGGVLAGLGLVTIPGIGPVLAAGWLVTAAVGFVTGAAAGLVAGGLIGALVEAGIPEEHAHNYAEGIKAGGTLVTARVSEREFAEAHAILNEARSIDVSTRQSDSDVTRLAGKSAL
jgi:hypothetical protein